MAPKNKKKAAAAKDDTEDTAAPKLKPANAINVRHILCEKQSEMLEAKSKLEEGQSFDAVAREYSTDKRRQGGALGWKTRGSLVADFEKVAYGLQVSPPSSPIYADVKTEHGYHLIMVEGRK